MSKGFNHIGLATRDMDRTEAFYRDVLGFRTMRTDRIEVIEGGMMRHLFMDCGNNQLISFLGPEGVPGIGEFDAGINVGLGVPRSFYHFAFHSDSEDELLEQQANLTKKGIAVSPVIDHDWCKSIYFVDPVNGLSLEFSAYARAFTEDDWTLKTRFTSPFANFDYDATAMQTSESARWEALEHDGEAERDAHVGASAE